jgi:hypothetical protein
MSIPVGTKMLTEPPKQKSKTHLKKHTFKKKKRTCTKTLLNSTMNSEKGKCTLFKAVGLRKDDVHRRIHDEFDSN